MAISQMPAALPMGTLVNDRFRVKKLLGYGGYGNVYLVEDEQVFLGNQYALKESLSTTTSERRQFTREARWLMSLEHPNLPRVADQFEWNGRPYFVMAYIAGENLEDRVDRFGPLPEEQVLGWILPICDAVLYLHSQKRPIIHRDVKPGNIIVTKDGRPWLVDFGIAKVLQPGPSRKTTRAARAVSGGYSPLEQYTRGGTDTRSDVYALGATLYHLLTGICPPEAPDTASGVARLPDPRQVYSRISKQTEQVVIRAMRHKPEERFQSMRELMDALPGGRGFTTTTGAPAIVPTNSGKSKRSRAAKSPAAAAPAPQPAPVLAPTLVAMPYQPPAQQTPPAATFIGPQPSAPLYPPPPAGPLYAPQPSPQPYTPQPAWVAPAVMPPQQVMQVQPIPVSPPVYQAPPQPLPVPREPQPSAPPVSAPPAKLPKPKRRIGLAAIVALLCGLGVIASLILSVIYWHASEAPLYVTRYDSLKTDPLWLPISLSLAPLAGLALVLLPSMNWLRMLGRIFTYAMLLLTSLLGLAATIVWMIAITSPPGGSPTASNILYSLFEQGFYIPIVCFGLPLGTAVVQIVRRK